jgi:arsenate reductase (thioredoxin)
MSMNSNPILVFVCEHGAAKSVVAAAHFNRLVSEMGLDLRAVARGTNPDHELSPQTIKGLSEDGLTPTESIPQKLTEADIRSARQIVAFCEVPEEYYGRAVIEYWDDIPPVSENYEKARDVIIERIRQMLKQ